MKLNTTLLCLILLSSLLPASQKLYRAKAHDNKYLLSQINEFEKKLPRVNLPDSIKTFLKQANLDSTLIPIEYNIISENSFIGLEFPTIVTEPSQIKRAEEKFLNLIQKCDLPFQRGPTELRYFLRSRKNSKLTIVLPKVELWKKAECLETELNTRGQYQNIDLSTDTYTTFFLKATNQYLKSSNTLPIDKESFNRFTNRLKHAKTQFYSRFFKHYNSISFRLSEKSPRPTKTTLGFKRSTPNSDSLVNPQLNHESHLHYWNYLFLLLAMTFGIFIGTFLTLFQRKK